MKILAIGDIFGRPGRDAIIEHLPNLIKEEKADFVLVNVENSSGGKGLTRKNFDEISNCGIDV
ncbi:YmdB family metallophosphoesterase, partial [bacterium]|nr:YmdB family metallophosphoesterase [bacterium]